MTREMINNLVLDWLTSPIDVNTITVCKPMRYRRRKTDLTRQSLKSRPTRLYRGMC